MLDMFLLYPSLMHRVSLPLAIKDQFRQLKIPAPHDLFIRLPSNASIWQDLQIYQSTALTNLAARGILKKSAIREGQADIELEPVPPELRHRLREANAGQIPLMDFLVSSLSALPIVGREGLARRAALPARGVAL